jgi:predicted acyltransferase
MRDAIGRMRLERKWALLFAAVALAAFAAFHAAMPDQPDTPPVAEAIQ